MELPLYEELRTEKPELKPGGNTGLWFERFFDAYSTGMRPKEVLSTAEKERVIEQEDVWLNSFAKEVGIHSKLEKKALQQIDLVQALNGEACVYKTQWHFVTGMGLPHPIENGFAWHPTQGVPYLTGAAVKGIVRAWLEVWDASEEETQQKKRLLKWFGSDDKNPDKQIEDSQVGSLIFFDALPVSRPKLAVDIMTPHMGDWYAKGKDIVDVKRDSAKIPADWHDPVPVKYLVVEEMQLLFAIAPRSERSLIDHDEMNEVMKAVENALEWMGAGAKTAVGYGYFNKDEDRTKDLEDKCQLLKLTSEERIYKEIEALDVTKIPKMLGKDKTNTLKKWGNEQAKYLECIKKIYGDIIFGWKSSDNPNEKKAFKVIFSD